MGSNQTKIFYFNAHYQGQAKDGRPQGRGQLTFTDDTTFTGNFIDGQAVCGILQNTDFHYQGELSLSTPQQPITGVLTDQYGTTYSGTFINYKLQSGTITNLIAKPFDQLLYSCCGSYSGTSILEGVGKFHNITEKYIVSGTFYKGNITGHGRYQHPNGDVYEGEMHGGTRSGNGVYVGAGFRLNGEFFRDCPSGTVEIDFANGDVYRGGMKNGSLHGRGRYVYKSGSSYEGEFYKGSMLGDCVMSYVQGEVFKYEGGNNEGLYDGLGVIYYRNGVIFRGWFNQGCKHGTGVLVCCRKTFKCVYSYDRLLGGLKPIVCQGS